MEADMFFLGWEREAKDQGEREKVPGTGDWVKTPPK